MDLGPTRHCPHGRLDGQGERERGATVLVVAGPDLAVVGVDERSDDGESHAKSVGLRRVEGVEDPLLVALGETDAPIADRRLQTRVLVEDCRDTERMAHHAAHGVQAVHDEIQDHLLELDTVGVHGRQPGREVEDHFHTSHDGVAVHQQDDVLDDGVEIERAALRRILPEEGQQVCRGAGLGGPREIQVLREELGLDPGCREAGTETRVHPKDRRHDSRLRVQQENALSCETLGGNRQRRHQDGHEQTEAGHTGSQTTHPVRGTPLPRPVVYRMGPKSHGVPDRTVPLCRSPRPRRTARRIVGEPLSVHCRKE